MKMFFGIFVLLLVVSAQARSKDDDKIQELPGLAKQPSFKQYSGYLSGDTDNYQLHYWFVEAQSNAESAPLVLWLNGGPGCSSMEGFLSENGPFTVVEDKKLIVNEQSWNKLANVLYIEAPAGVGYSYAADANVTTDDDLTSLNNYGALKSFVERFPEYKGRDFYITGESYGGVYVPTLALRVLHGSDLDLNLKGIAVGNGLTSYDLNDNSLIYFAAYHGLIGDSIWQQLLSDCCDDPSKVQCHFTHSKKPQCQSLVYNVNNIINSGLDIYNLYSECAGGVNTLWGHWATLNKGAFELHHESSSKLIHNDMGNLFRSNNYVKRRRNISLLSRKLHAPKVKLAIPCVNDTIITSYLNDPIVKLALNIKKGLPEWEVCSSIVNSGYIRTYQELSQQYTEIVKSGIKTYIYNGDVDMACNFIGDEWFVDSLGFELTEKRRSWLYVEQDQTNQIGGYTKKFVDKNQPEKTSLTFLTIRGSGHMAPTDKPLQSFHMFKSFIKDETL